MTRSRRTLVFVVLAVAFAALAVRLGFWQLHRLADRRAFNARLSARLALPPVAIDSLPPDTAAARYRRVRLRGTWDAAHEMILVSRTRNGSPGVNFITPLRLPGRDTAYLVNRGWAYAADGKTVDATAWREATDTATGEAFADVYPVGLAGPVVGEGATIRRLDPSALRARLPYPVATAYLVVQPSLADTTTRRATTPVRLAVPALSEGPHQSYAIQWFFFATVALVGAAAYVRADRRRGDPPPST